MRPRKPGPTRGSGSWKRPAVLRAQRRLPNSPVPSPSRATASPGPRPPTGTKRCGRSRPWSSTRTETPDGHEIGLRTIRASGPCAPEPGGSIQRTAEAVTARGCFPPSGPTRPARAHSRPSKEVQEQTLTPRHGRSHGAGIMHVRCGSRVKRQRPPSGDASEDERSAGQRSSDAARSPSTPRTALRQPARTSGPNIATSSGPSSRDRLLPGKVAQRP